jgi:hypothetical protein
MTYLGPKGYSEVRCDSGTPISERGLGTCEPIRMRNAIDLMPLKELTTREACGQLKVSRLSSHAPIKSDRARILTDRVNRLNTMRPISSYSTHYGTMGTGTLELVSIIASFWCWCHLPRVHCTWASRHPSTRQHVRNILCTTTVWRNYNSPP